MNLYVDDERPCPPGWHIARSVDEAIRMLSSSMHDLVDPITMVSLDHDIFYNIDVGEKDEDEKIVFGEADLRVISPENFQSVARYIALMPEPLRPEVVFHTANPAGEMKMRAILETEGVPDVALDWKNTMDEGLKP